MLKNRTSVTLKIKLEKTGIFQEFRSIFILEKNSIQKQINTKYILNPYKP
jgi:hypothetical protein